MEPVCATTIGQVRGHVTDVPSPDGTTTRIAAFLGVPYARVESMFGPPLPVEPWAGVLSAEAYGPTVPKMPYEPPLDALIPESTVVGEPGESPLNLNVWTPSPGPGARLPVLVWIHGGAFVNGSGSASGYDGGAFARDGAVCVTLNYRLGAAGFLHLAGVRDNRGLLDQIAALRWVQDNIAAFGGDPDRVTVFGESAGAMSIGVLLGMADARGLFRRAALQSGAAHHFLPPSSARLITARLGEKLSVTELTAEAFAAVPEERLLPAQAELRAELGRRPEPALWGEAARNMMPFEPVLEDVALPRADSGVDLLVGSNREEYRLFLVPAGRLHALSARRLRATAADYGLDPDDPEKGLRVYRDARPGASEGEVFDAMATDWFYRIPAIRLAESVPGSYMYEFAWRSPRFDGQLGACHSLEIGFVFDRLRDAGYGPILGEDPPQELADTMHRAWLAFAETGDPGWAPYDTDTRTTMVFDRESGAADDLRPRERALWDGVR